MAEPWRDDEERRRRAARLKAIEITTRRVVSETLAGQYHSVFKGRGLEFDQVRPYMAGDDVRAIDWNVTARAQTPYVRQYHEERELTVMLMVDCSASGQFGTRAQSKVELAAELSALLAFSAIRNNDKVGLLLFTDRVEKVILPKKGRRHVLRVVNDILSFNPEGRGTNLQAALTYLSRLKIHRAVVFLISDFLDAGFDDGLRVIGRKHDLAGFRVVDPAETRLPDLGLVPMENPETGAVEWVDTSDAAVRRHFEETWSRHEQTLTRLFRKHNLELAPVACGEDYVPRLVAFFRRRAKRH
ncbi:MAG: DUF58 domain-containing protein [Myxococcales bacterium]|nr:MAG: DUF58 domain-containing protein [Myxococcales bacterium]